MNVQELASGRWIWSEYELESASADKSPWYRYEIRNDRVGAYLRSAIDKGAVNDMWVEINYAVVIAQADRTA